MEHRIDTTTGRRKVAPRREPYWARLEAGAYLGFRKLDVGEGTWVARWRAPNGKQSYHALGHFPEYDEAVKAARAWFTQCQGGSPRKVTVAEACRRYVENRRLRKGDAAANDADGRFRRHVYESAIGRIGLSQLKPADLEAWLAGLIRVDDEDVDAERRSKDSANRDFSALKAALNLAFRDGLVASDTPWRRVAAFGDVARRRERFLSLAQRRRLLTAASPDFKQLIRAVALTAARPGEIATSAVGALDRRARTLTLAGKTGRRTVPLSPDAFTFLAACAKSRAKDDPILVRQNGSAWDRFAWRKEMQLAVNRARLPPDVVLYSLRHAAISEMLTSGLDPLSVARLAGTSVLMISKHYGHLVQDHVRAKLARVKVL